MSYGSFLLYLYILAISFFPRIPIMSLGSGKTVDVRLEDFIILLAAITLPFFMEKKTKLFEYEKWLIRYILYVICVTLIGMLIDDLFFQRLAFLLKEIELIVFYFLIVLSRGNFSQRGCRNLINFWAITTILAIIYQIISGDLWGRKTGYYGIGVIGEYGSMASGIVCLFLSIWCFSNIRRGKKNALFGVLLVVGLLFTSSRATISAFGIYVVRNFLKLKSGNIAKVVFIVVGLGLLYILWIPTDIASNENLNSRSFDVGYVFESIYLRVVEGYLPSFEAFANTYGEIFYLIGIGKGFVGMNGFPIEIHNQFLRWGFELGFIGLVILFSLFRSFRKSLFVPRLKSLPIPLAEFFVALLAASIFQDGFNNQKGLTILLLLVIFHGLQKRGKLK